MEKYARKIRKSLHFASEDVVEGPKGLSFFACADAVREGVVCTLKGTCNVRYRSMMEQGQEQGGKWFGLCWVKVKQSTVRGVEQRPIELFLWSRTGAESTDLREISVHGQITFSAVFVYKRLRLLLQIQVSFAFKFRLVFIVSKENRSLACKNRSNRLVNTLNRTRKFQAPET
ncbi:hypothetical protein MRB53_008466 [Persea americana]|uniref:Uncharacterized protein n=1 Tax=Persea americana TaxID=3435 RepID=A0ACC2MM74_PERAE|nr:hypothetical protein MRB53_008466 [Persea americana]